MRNHRIIEAFCLLAALALTPACQHGGEGLGTVPRGLVDLYDQADPGGLLEIEIDRDGTIREMEGDIRVEDLPDVVRQRAEERLPDATITGAERELKPSGESWEVKMKDDERAYELVLDGFGDLIEKEVELRREEAPEAVLAGADREIQGGEFVSVERIERGDEVEYHVKKRQGGGQYKIVLREDGSLIRKVREARAEIEIPLK